MRTAILFALLFGITGCQLTGAKFPDNPKNTLEYKRGWGSGSLAMSNGADSTVIVEDARVDPETKEFSVKKIEYRAAPSVNQEKLLPMMVEYTNQLQKDNEREKIRGDNAERLWGKLNESLPFVTQMVTAGFGAGVTKATKPGLIGELTKLLEQIKSIDPSIVSAVVSNVSAPSPPPSP